MTTAEKAAADKLAADNQARIDSLNTQLSNEHSLSQASLAALASAGSPQTLQAAAAASNPIPQWVWFVAAGVAAWYLYKRFK